MPPSRKSKQTTAIVICFFVILSVTPELLLHWNKIPVVGDYLMLEVTFFILAEMLYLLKNFNRP